MAMGATQCLAGFLAGRGHAWQLGQRGQRIGHGSRR
jgi:hypothetical protein